MRPAGIQALGDLPWGTHFCQFYQDKQDLLDILVPYFKAGLENNEFCMWVASAPLMSAEAKEALAREVGDLGRYLDKGQIEFLDHSQWYTLNGKFEPERVMRGWVEKLEAAQKRGFEGLRLTGNTSWLEAADWPAFMGYETTVNGIIGRYRMLALYSYSLEKCGPNEILDAVSQHAFALSKRGKTWQVIENLGQKKTATALQENERRATAEIQHQASFPRLNPNPILELDAAGNLLFANQAVGDNLQRMSLQDPSLFFPTDLPWILSQAGQGRQETYQRDVAVGDKIFSETVCLVPQFNTLRIYAYDATEARRAQQILRESEESFRALAENIPDHIIRFDQNLKILYSNPAAVRRTGLSGEALAGRRAGEYGVPAETAGAWEQAARAVLATGEPTRYEHTNQWQGETRFFDVQIVPERSQDGAVRNGIALARDITERKKAEEALRKSERRLDAVFNGVTETIMMMDLNGTVLAANATAAQRFGLSVSEIIGKTGFNLTLPEIREKRALQIQTMLTTGQPVRFVDERQGVLYDLTFYPVRDESGTINQFVVFTRDITEQKRAEAALDQSEDRYRSLVELSPDAVFVNRGNRVVYLNPAAMNLFGVSSPESLLGKSPFDLFHPDFHEIMQERIRQLNQGRSVPLIEEKIIQAGGGVRDVEVAASAFTDGEGQAFQVILRDITERKLSEAVKARYHLISRYARDPLLLMDRDGRIIEGNKAAEEFYGYDREQMLALRIRDLRPADSQETVNLQMAQAWSEGMLFETIHVRKDGTLVPVEVSSRGVTVDGQEMLLSVIRDISKRRQAEEALHKSESELKRLNRTLKALNDSSQAMMRAADEGDYLREVCKIIIEDCGQPLVWIGYAQNDEAKTIRPMAFAGFEAGYLDTLKLTWADTERGRGPTGTAIRTGKISFCKNMLTDPEFKPWRQEALKRGYASSLALPLLGGLTPAIGALTIYFTEPDPFSDDEVRLLSELASDLAHGIMTLRLRATHALAQAQLRISEERFRIALKHAPVSVAAQDRDLRFVWAYNQKTADPAEVLGKTDTDIFAADDAQLLMRLKRRVMATGCELKQQMWITSKGKRVFIDLYLEPLRDMHHNIIGVGVATVDLTERQEIAEELQITLKRFYSILSNLHSGILLVTDEDQVEFANQAFCDCFGLGDFPADLMKLTVSEIVEKIRKVYAEPEKAMARILKILEKDQLVKNEEVALSNNRTLLRDFVPLRLDDKQKGRLWIHLDITDRKQAAEALREINRRKDEFLATLGHELRNPLVPIRNAAHILTARSFSDPELVRLCGIIESQVGHMVRLVNDLLDISRIERGKIELQKEKVDIVQVLARVAEACRPLFDEKKQDLRVALPKRTLVLSGDSVRLEQVVGNLLNNASKFTPPGGTIHLSAVLQNASIVVRVRDEGVGMAPETLQNAFELFFQANTPGKRSQGGLGIGLTLVKRLVELHGGTVTASSAGLDQGSEFSLALPVKDFSLVKPARLKKTIRQKPASGKHILLIDDDQSVLKSMEMLLHAYGFRVSLAADGETGVDQALALRPDIALVDLGLPGLNGQETAARIRKALGKNIFLIALSGYAQKQNKTSAGAQGFDKYFIKPVNPDELIQTLGGVKIGKAGAKIGKGKTKTAKSKPTRG